MDRRIRRTRRRLRQALIDLIVAKGYSNITIQEITDKADLSRATFYLHYKGGKDELLADSLETLFEEFVSTLKQPLFDEQWIASDPSPTTLAFQHVAEHAELYKALLLGDRGVTYVIYREIQYTANIIETQLRRLLHDNGLDAEAVPVVIAAQQMAGALFSLILWWLEHDMPHPAEQMGQMYHQMAVPGVLSTLGLDYGVPS